VNRINYVIATIITTFNLKTTLIDSIDNPANIGAPEGWVEATFGSGHVGITSHSEHGNSAIVLAFPGNDGAIRLMMTAGDARRLAEAILENCPPTLSTEQN
jgi:hypothetical protein